MKVFGDDKEKEKMREIRYGLCFTSVWAVQNTHLFYIEDKDFKDVLAEIKKRIQLEKFMFIRRVPTFEALTYRQIQNVNRHFTTTHKIRGHRLFS